MDSRDRPLFFRRCASVIPHPLHRLEDSKCFVSVKDGFTLIDIGIQLLRSKCLSTSSRNKISRIYLRLYLQKYALQMDDAETRD